MNTKLVSGTALLAILSVMAISMFNIPSGFSTDVSGYISTNTTWALGGSPYVVVGDVVVESAATLTIKPGVVVRFTQGKNLVIDGKLMAKGSSTEKITFTSNASSPAPGDWGSIRIRSSAVCSIVNSVIEYASIGVNFESLGTPSNLTNTYLTSNVIGTRIWGYRMVLDDLIIQGSTDCGIFVEAGSLYIMDSLVSNNNIGIRGLWGGITKADNVTISNNFLDGISAHGMDIDDLINSDVSNNGGKGISIDRTLWNCLSTRVSGNLGGGVFVGEGSECYLIYKSNITDNLGDGVSGSGYVRISGSNISNNSGNGVLGANVNIVYSRIVDNGNIGIVASAGLIQFNNIYDNKGPYDVRNTGTSNINATNNWWGTTNQTIIAERIYDYYDDYNLGKIYYIPIQTSPVEIPPYPIPEFPLGLPLTLAFIIAFVYLWSKKKTENGRLIKPNQHSIFSRPNELK